MKRSTASLLVLPCLLLACGQSDPDAVEDTAQDLADGVSVPNPSGAYFADIKANGTGCPAGTWDAAISADGRAFTVTFSAYESTVGPGVAMAVKDCTLAIDLRTPEGLSFSVSSFYYQGYALLDQAGMTATQTAKYYFQGNPVPAIENRSDITGPHDDSYVFSDQIAVADQVWSPCGASRTLNAQTRIVLQNNPQKSGNGYLNTSSVDGEVKTVFRFGLDWRSCGGPTAPKAKQVVWQNTDGTPAVWSLQGTTVLSGAAVGTNPGTAWRLVGAADVDGDGKDELLWQNADGTAAVWFIDGSTLRSGAVVGQNPGTAWHLVGASDVDGDGKADFIWQNVDGTAAVWLLDGATVRSGAVVGTNPGSSWHLVTAADTNGDRKADFIWQNVDGTPAVWFLDGATVLSGAVIGSNPGTSWHLVGASDTNGDGKADLLWQNADGTPAIWLLNGSTTIGGAVVGSNPGTSWKLRGASDVDGDGKADFVWQNDDGSAAVWLLDGVTVKSGTLLGSNPGPSWRLVGLAAR